MLAADVATPFIWAGAAALIAGVAWVLRKAGSAAVDDRIDPKLRPFYERLDLHLQNEEDERRETNRRLSNIEGEFLKVHAREGEDHRRIWSAIEELKRSR